MDVKVIQRIVAVLCIWYLFASVEVVVDQQSSNKRKRTKDVELPYHCKRKRTLWSPFILSLGTDEFAKHHRISNSLFKKIHKKIRKHIQTQSKYVRKSCCRGDLSHIDSRSRLSMLLRAPPRTKVPQPRDFFILKKSVTSKLRVKEGTRPEGSTISVLFEVV